MGDPVYRRENDGPVPAGRKMKTRRFRLRYAYAQNGAAIRHALFYYFNFILRLPDKMITVSREPAGRDLRT